MTTHTLLHPKRLSAAHDLVLPQSMTITLLDVATTPGGMTMAGDTPFTP